MPLNTPLHFIRDNPGLAVKFIDLVDAARDNAVPCQNDPELWWSLHGPDILEAKRLCVGCPIRVACGEWALRANENEGVWGGLSASDRLSIKLRIKIQERKRAAAGA